MFQSACSCRLVCVTPRGVSTTRNPEEAGVVSEDEAVEVARGHHVPLRDERVSSANSPASVAPAAAAISIDFTGSSLM